MVLNKKTRVWSACLLMIFILASFSGCIVMLPSDYPSAMPNRENGCYISGEFVELSVPDEGTYFYNQLTKAQKTIYTASIYALEAGENVFELVGVNCKEYADGSKLATEALIRDYPEYFWINGGHQIKTVKMGTSQSGTVEITLKTHKYWDGKNLDAAREELETVVLEIIRQANTFTDTYEKVKFVNDYLAQNVEYDFDSYYHPSKMDDMDDAFVNTVYGTLIGRNTLCGGYAYTFSYIMNRLGFETLYITGKTKDGLHAWNLINLDGEYYQIDVTWSDDNKNDLILYTYFCLTDEEMLLTHTPDKEFDYPSAAGTQYNYFIREGLYLDSYSFNKFNAMFAARDPGSDFSVRFANSVVMKAAKDSLIDNGKFYKLEGMGEKSSFSYFIDEDYNILTLCP